MWFDSPGHHVNMAGGSNAIGVGRWHDHYTQNFGAGPRVMLMSEEDRSKLKVEGPVLGMDAGAGSTGKRSGENEKVRIARRWEFLLLSRPRQMAFSSPRCASRLGEVG